MGQTEKWCRMDLSLRIRLIVRLETLLHLRSRQPRSLWILLQEKSSRESGGMALTERTDLQPQDTITLQYRKE